MISIVVEGATDLPFVRKVCEHARVTFHEPIVIRRGKSQIDSDLPKWANAAKHSPYLIVRDLDHDAECAPAWVRTNLPKHPGKWLLVRLAVRAVESWFLADTQTVAACLRVDISNVPRDPDRVSDPKAMVVELARRSSNDTIRKRVAPGPKDSRRVGPQYEQRLIEWSAKWRVEVAMKRSASLRKAYAAIRRLDAEYARYVKGGAR